MDNHGFASVDELREINIGHEDKPGLMYVSTKSDPKVQARVDKFIRGCSAWLRSIGCLIFGLKGSGATYQ